MSNLNNTVDNAIFTPELNGQGEGVVDGDNQDTSPAQAGQDVADVDVNDDGRDVDNDNGYDSEEDSGQRGEEKLYAGTFKSVEEMEKGYENIRALATKLGEELGQLRRKVGSQNIQGSQQGYQTVPQAQGNSPIDRLVEVITDRVSSVYAPVIDRMAALETKDAVNALAVSDPENFKEVAPKLIETIEKNPWLESVPNYVEVAYKIAKSEILESKMSQAVSKARKEAYESKDIKVLNSEGARRARHTETPKSPEDAIIEGILGAPTGKLRI